jgi:hypothetical protein
LKLPIIINGKKTVHEFPTDWDNVSFRSFLEIPSDETDIIKIIALILKIDYDVLCRAKIIGFDELVERLAFLKVQPVPRVPKTCLGYPIPKDLGFETVGQFKDLNQYIKEISGLPPIEQFKKYPLLVAVYACVHMDELRCKKLGKDLGLIGNAAEELGYGKYDWRKAEAMADDFLNAPCTEVMGIGNFTLLRLIALKNNIRPNFPKVNSRWQNYRQVLKSWPMILAVIQRFFTLKKKPVTKEVS